MIVSCGEAVIDFLPMAGEAAAVFQARPGGSPFNVAVALGRLGIPAGFFGGLSTDHFGTMLREMLAVSGVDSGFAASSPRPSTLAFARKVADETEYDFFDEGSAGRMLTDMELPAFPRIVTGLHFGSFSLAEEPCGSAFEMLMQREQRDRVISLDPNIRPTLIKNREGYVARIERLAAMSDIIKLSQGDLAWLAPDADFADVAERWLAKGSRLVLLTKGAAGAEARTRIASASVEAGRTRVVDTIGAGDVFTAGMLAHLHGAGRLTKDGLARLTSSEIEEALRYAAKAALLSVGRAGADPPWRREVV